MPSGVRSLGWRKMFCLAAALVLSAAAARATPFLVADADSGQVLIENEGAAVWYPASLTKLMTVYVALDAVRAGKLTLDTPLVMSARAARMPPSKMGFHPGTEVTLDNALKMLMVKSPNDVAVMVAEGVSGSVEAFADDMNATARRLGLHESHFVNPNGLHDPNNVSSARDMAIIARALLREFPQHADLFGIGALQLGNHIIPNHNGLLGRYPGADGMKTGFTCPAGFNLVASANHFGRRLIVVVLGSPAAKLRTLKAADLLDRGFAMGGGSGSLDSLPASGSGVAPNMRGDTCTRRNAAAIAAAEEQENMVEPSHVAQGGRGGGVFSAFAASIAPTHTQISDERPVFNPVPVFIGPVPGWKGPVLAARPKNTAPPAAPEDAKAYSAEKPVALGDTAGDGAQLNAPAVLQGAVRTPPAALPGRKPVRHAVAENKGPKKPAPTKPAKAKDDKTDKRGAVAD
jgi:D-alanyl-D-alanine carboxypeptidase